jgi:hypothetical protein
MRDRWGEGEELQLRDQFIGYLGEIHRFHQAGDSL